MPAVYRLDSYVVDSLMPDLVGQDRQPSAFLVYVYLWCRATRRRATASLQHIASDTGLSKSAVQKAIRTLKRRRLIQAHQSASTAVPVYTVDRPWLKKRAS